MKDIYYNSCGIPAFSNPPIIHRDIKPENFLFRGISS